MIDWSASTKRIRLPILSPFSSVEGEMSFPQYTSSFFLQGLIEINGTRLYLLRLVEFVPSLEHTIEPYSAMNDHENTPFPGVHPRYIRLFDIANEGAFIGTQLYGH
jgi:hypothetical protein